MIIYDKKSKRVSLKELLAGMQIGDFIVIPNDEIPKGLRKLVAKIHKDQPFRLTYRRKLNEGIEIAKVKR